MTPTLDDIRRAGLEALREKLGRAGMVRFLQQFENGSGDYSRERQEWVDQSTLDGLRKRAAPKSAPPKRRKR